MHFCNTRDLVPSCGGKEDRLLVGSCILEKLEKGLRTRSLVLSCGGREDTLLVVNYFLEKLEKGLITGSLVPSCGGREDSRNFRNCLYVAKF